jgi:Do/DeqQ family serine protease
MKRIFSILNHSLTKYLVAILFGVLMTVGAYKVMPSQAGPLTQTPSSNLVTQAPSSSSISNFVSKVVKEVGPAVVRIDVEKTVTRQIDPMLNDPFFRRFFGDDLSNQMPRQEVVKGLGSGFIIDRSGIILTNAHVVDGADRVTVKLKDGRTLEGQVKGVDTVTDLAVVKVDDNNLPIVPLGDSTALEVGDWAIAMGNPLGLNNTVTLGIVSTLDRSSAQAGIPDKRLDFIQTDAAINPGNSGGPLLNERGEVIGINTAIRNGAEGIGFAIPINIAKRIYPQLEQGQAISHPYLGVQMIALTPELAQENNKDINSPMQLPEINGVLVVQVLPNTPAAKGGLRRGDVIIEFNGEPVTEAEKLQSLVEKSTINQSVSIKIQRGNQKQTLSIALGNLQNFQQPEQ